MADRLLMRIPLFALVECGYRYPISAWALGNHAPKGGAWPWPLTLNGQSGDDSLLTSERRNLSLLRPDRQTPTTRCT